MQHYGLSALCDVGYVNEKISGTFIERLLVETLPDLDRHVLNPLCTVRPVLTRIKKLILFMPSTLAIPVCEDN